MGSKFSTAKPMLTKARNAKKEVHPRSADWPACSAMVTGPDRLPQEACPTNIRAKICTVVTDNSQHLWPASSAAFKGSWRTKLWAGGSPKRTPTRPTHAWPSGARSGLTSISNPLSPRRCTSQICTLGGSVWPAWRMSWRNSLASSGALPSTRKTRSPRLMPAAWATLPTTTSVTTGAVHAPCKPRLRSHWASLVSDGACVKSI